MALCFYYASGSPYGWRVWLSLEHKGLRYELRTLSFSAGDLTKPQYLAINPRHKVPALTDDGLAIYESAAIVEYLESADRAGPAHAEPPPELGVREALGEKTRAWITRVEALPVYAKTYPLHWKGA